MPWGSRCLFELAHVQAYCVYMWTDVTIKTRLVWSVGHVCNSTVTDSYEYEVMNGVAVLNCQLCIVHDGIANCEWGDLLCMYA